MSERNERFNAMMLSLDQLADEIDISKSALFSDRGKGAEQIRSFEELAEEAILKADKRQECRAGSRLRLAYEYLRYLHRGNLVPTLQKIVKNGSNREATIAEIRTEHKIPWSSARRLYYGHRNVLFKIFGWNGR